MNVQRFNEYHNNNEYDYSVIFDQLLLFLGGKRTNQYIRDDAMSIYIRKSRRLIDGEMIQFLDLANIQIEDDYQNKGIYSNLMKKIVEKYPDYNIFIENILNPHTEPILKKLGFKYTDSVDRCMYMINNKELKLKTPFSI